MKKLYKNHLLKSISALLSFVSLNLNAQCNLGTSSGTLAPATGTAFVISPAYPLGQYFNFPVLSGGSYGISTCGSTVNTQLSCWDATGTSTLAYNDDNGPLCSGLQASINNFIPSFTNFMKVQVSEFNCLLNSSSSVNVYVRQNNNLAFTSSAAPLCSGQTLTLTATPANVGSTPGGYGDPGTFTGTAVSGNVFTAPVVSSPTTYTITYTFGYVSQTQTLVVNPVPVVGASASGAVVCSGASLTLNGSGASTYSWTGGVSNGLPFVPSATNTYSVVGTNSFGCVSSNQATVMVTVNPTPTVIASALSYILCYGGSTSVTASGASTYTWSGGVSNGVAFIPSVTTSYSVTGTSSAGCTSNQAIVTITVANPAICMGGTTALSGGGAGFYLWTGGVINGIPFSPTVTTTYSVIGNNTLTGCVNSTPAVATITVNPLPVISVVSSKSVICKGETAYLFGSGASSFTWNTGSTGTVLSIAPNVSTTYTLVGKDANNCLGSAVFTQTVLQCDGLSTSHAAANPMQIFPNPNNGDFEISSESDVEISVVNELGQLIKTLSLNQSNSMVKITNLQTGIYFIIGQNAGGLWKNKVIITR